MQLVDRNNQNLTVVRQIKLDKTDTVYNFKVDEFHTYHIGKFGGRSVSYKNADSKVLDITHNGVTETEQVVYRKDSTTGQTYITNGWVIK